MNASFSVIFSGIECTGPTDRAANSCARTIRARVQEIADLRLKILNLSGHFRNVRQVNHLQAVIGANTPHNVVDVVLECLFGDSELRRNLLVRQTLSDRWNHLLLPTG